MKTENGISNLNFGQALDQLKRGEALAREGWNGKSMFIYLNKGSKDFYSDYDKRGTEDKIEGLHWTLFEKGIRGQLPGFLISTLQQRQDQP